MSTDAIRNYPDGKAAYQYTSGDINFYSDQFGQLFKTAERFAKRLARP
jgi:hypothetical protein